MIYWNEKSRSLNLVYIWNSNPTCSSGMLSLYHLHRHHGQPINRQYKLRVHSGQNWCSIEKEEPAICHPPWLGLTFNTHRETTLTYEIQKSFLYENCYFTAVGRWAVNRTDPQLWTDKRRNGTYWEELGRISSFSQDFSSDERGGRYSSRILMSQQPSEWLKKWDFLAQKLLRRNSKLFEEDLRSTHSKFWSFSWKLWPIPFPNNQNNFKH